MVTIVENKHNIGVIHKGKLIESSGSYILYVLGEYCTDQITKLEGLLISNVTDSIVKEYRDGDSYHIIFWQKSIYILDRSALRIILVTTPKICDKWRVTPKICDKWRVTPKICDKWRVTPKICDKWRVTPKICDKWRVTPKICDKWRVTPEIMFIDPDKPELLQYQRYDTQTCKVINYTREGDKFIIGGKKYRIGREIEPDVMQHIWGLYLCDEIYIVAP
jgi:hypothetical protein